MLLFSLFAAAAAIDSPEQLQAKWGGDWSFSGITTFAHLPSQRCLTQPETTFDVALIGVPFDTAVSYRPGARFGPRAIRAASMRQTNLRGFNARAGFNPYQDWADVLDCEDMPVTPMDNKLALNQMADGFANLLEHKTTHPEFGTHPRLVALGGDHSIVLPHLRALAGIYGPISVIHFDAHLDTWLPSKYPSGWDSKLGAGMEAFTHGTMFWMAHEEGLLSPTCIHAGLRTRLSGTEFEDYLDDTEQGFARISTDDIDDLGTQGIVEIIEKRIPPGAPVYISVDIDVLDPSIAPGTGTPEVGGWTPRELIRLLRGVGHLNIVGADIVEVSPSYDHAENTALAGAQVAYELMTSMVLGRSKTGARSNPSREELRLGPSSYDLLAQHAQVDKTEKVAKSEKVEKAEKTEKTEKKAEKKASPKAEKPAKAEAKAETKVKAVPKEAEAPKVTSKGSTLKEAVAGAMEAGSDAAHYVAEEVAEVTGELETKLEAEWEVLHEKKANHEKQQSKEEL